MVKAFPVRDILNKHSRRITTDNQQVRLRRYSHIKKLSQYANNIRIKIDLQAKVFSKYHRIIFILDALRRWRNDHVSEKKKSQSVEKSNKLL